MSIISKKNVLVPLSLTKKTHIHIQKGNNKLGKEIATFNLLPGDILMSKSTGLPFTNVRGTCKGVCQYCENDCYAVRDAKLHYNAVLPSAGANTLLMRYRIKQAEYEIVSWLKKHKSIQEFRWHSSGEIESLAQLELMNNVAVKFPNIRFGTYTKRFDILEEFCKKHGKVADNFTINLSVWRDNFDKLKYDFKGNKFNYFVYHDPIKEPSETIAKMIHCPAVKKPIKGHKKGSRNKNITCSQCGRCYKGNKGLYTAVYSH